MGRKRSDVAAIDKEIARARSERDVRKARAEELVREIDELRKTITKAFWDVGRRLKEVRDEKLHAMVGFERFDTFVEERLGFSNSVAWRLVMIAEQLPRATAAELGQEKAYALLAYTRAKAEPESPAELAAKDADIGGKPLSQATVRDLMEATRAARVPRPKSIAQRAADAETSKMVNAMKALLRKKDLGNPAFEVRADGLAVVFTKHQIARLLRA